MTLAEEGSLVCGRQENKELRSGQDTWEVAGGGGEHICWAQKESGGVTEELPSGCLKQIVGIAASRP